MKIKVGTQGHKLFAFNLSETTLSKIDKRRAKSEERSAKSEEPRAKNQEPKREEGRPRF